MNERRAHTYGQFFLRRFWEIAPALAGENEYLVRLFGIDDPQKTIFPMLNLFRGAQFILLRFGSNRIGQKVEKEYSIPEAWIVRKAEVALNGLEETESFTANYGPNYILGKADTVRFVNIV